MVEVRRQSWLELSIQLVNQPFLGTLYEPSRALGVIQGGARKQKAAARLGEIQAEVGKPEKDPDRGLQAVSVLRTKSLEQVRGWVPGHNTLGPGLLSYPNLRVGVALRSKGFFKDEGRATLFIDVLLISDTIPD